MGAVSTRKPVFSPSVRSALTWSVGGALLAGATLLALAILCSPEQITSSPYPFRTVLHVLAAGLCLHCACTLPLGELAVWLGRRRRWLGHGPRAMALGLLVAPPLLGVWLFVFRTGRLDAVTFLGTACMVAFALVVSCWGAVRLEIVDPLASRLAPASLALLVSGLAFMAVPTLTEPASPAEISPKPRSETVSPAVASPSSYHPRTVLLLTIDTLRADHLGAWGYPRAVSPNLDRLAAEGSLFEDMMAASSGTIPSFGVIHTGLTPDCNGVLDQHSVLAAGQTTLSERFSEAGYTTLGVAANPLMSAKHGFEQGFDSFVNLGEANGEEVVAQTMTLWQSLPTDDAVFAWVHLYDPHTPYMPPDEDQRGFAEDSLVSDRSIPTIRFGSWGGAHLYRTFGKGAAPVSHVTEGDLVARYDGEILSTDRAVGHLLAWLAQTGRVDDAVVLVTADHGETLVRERRDIVCQHAFQLYDDSLHVPLILWGHGIPALRSKARAQHVDILPTLLAAAGLPPDPSLPGRSLLDAGPGPSVRMARTAWWDALSLRLVPHKGRAPSLSVRTDRWKLIVHPHDDLATLSTPGGWLDAWRNLLTGIWRDDQLYDLAADPGEQRDVANENPGEAEKLRSALFEARSATSAECAVRGAAELTLDQETLRNLRAVGYLD